MVRLWTLTKFCEFIVTCPNKPDCGRCIDYSSNMVAALNNWSSNWNTGRSCNPQHVTTKIWQASQCGNDWPINAPISATSCTAPMCEGQTARNSPGKLRPHRHHSTSSPAEDIEGIHIPTGRGTMRTVRQP